MRQKSESKMQQILDCVDRYFSDYGEVPSVRDIAEDTGIAITTVHRYLTALKESGQLEYCGRRSIITKRINMESAQYSMPVLGYVRCGPGEEEEEAIIEYIRLPESMIGRGEFFALIAKGESMIDAGIHPGDYVIVRKQNNAEPGDLIVALYDGLNNLKQLAYDDDERRYVLRSCNEDKEAYPDIPFEELTIQGVAVGVYHGF
jgi:repressor LexA